MLNDIGGVAALAVALFFVGRSIRSDAGLTKRLNEYATGLEVRIVKLERAGRRDRTRIHQLEKVLREAGMEIPPWPEREDDDEIADLDPGFVTVTTTTRSAL